MLRPTTAGVVGADLAALRLDQVVEPFDVVLGGVLPVTHEGQRVVVDALSGVLQRRRDGGQSLLEVRASSLQQPDAGLGLQVLEEGQADAEPVVLPGLLSSFLQQLVEQALALLGDAVDVLAAADVLLREDRLDRPIPLEPAEGGVERAVRHPPEAPEGVLEALGELVAVHGPLLQQAQDSKLEHLVRPLTRGRRPLHVAARYIGPIYRLDISYEPGDPLSNGVQGRLSCASYGPRPVRQAAPHRAARASASSTASPRPRAKASPAAKLSPHP